MLDERSIREIFYNALKLHRIEHRVNENDIAKAIVSIQDGYAAKKWSSGRKSEPLNYDDPAYRCGYLHKYASCHASLVQHVIKCIGPDVFGDLFESLPVINVCCIGGGPGTDVIGLCAVFYSMPELMDKLIHFEIVDCMREWKKAFASVLSASHQYGSFGTFLFCNTSNRYQHADMLSCITDPVRASISDADLVTMVKFVSAAASGATPKMLHDVFTLMKPGAAVLFIDNAGGGFYELVSRCAQKCGFVNVSGPYRHMKYTNEAFKRKMFGYFSLSSTTVAVQLWKKKKPVTVNQCGRNSKSGRFSDTYAETSGCRSSNFPNSGSQEAARSTSGEKKPQNSTVNANSCSQSRGPALKGTLNSSFPHSQNDCMTKPSGPGKYATQVSSPYSPGKSYVSKPDCTSPSKIKRDQNRFGQSGSAKVNAHGDFSDVESDLYICRPFIQSSLHSLDTSSDPSSGHSNRNRRDDCECCIIL